LLDAQQKAMGLLENVVVRQSSFSSYLDAFMLIGLFFTLSLPLLLLVMKRQKGPVKVVLNDH
jgi:DHA2 family multidrug resistance protein